MKKVMIIDDDESFHFLCEMLFKRHDESITVLRAYDGEEALEALRDETVLPDLILLDINMPRMNGHEFLAAYAERTPSEIPIVAMLTSSDQDSDRTNALSYKFVKNYLLKPLRKSDLDSLKQIYRNSLENVSAAVPAGAINETAR